MEMLNFSLGALGALKRVVSKGELSPVFKLSQGSLGKLIYSPIRLKEIKSDGSQETSNAEESFAGNANRQMKFQSIDL